MGSFYGSEVIGAPDWTRTSDPCLRRAVLYPLSYRRCRDNPIPDKVVTGICAKNSLFAARRPSVLMHANLAPPGQILSNLLTGK